MLKHRAATFKTGTRAAAVNSKVTVSFPTPLQRDNVPDEAVKTKIFISGPVTHVTK